MSSLFLKISAKETPKSILVSELTGAYSSQNTGGYGVQTVTITQVTKSYLNITRGKESFYVDLKPLGFPTTDDCMIAEILPSQVGSKGCIKSGKYVIEYVVEGVNGSGQPFKYATKYVLLATDCVAECVDKLNRNTVNVPVDKFMKDDRKTTSIEMGILMENVLWAKCCGLIDYADEIIQYIYSKGCSC